MCICPKSDICHFSFTINKARHILNFGQDLIHTFLRHGRYQLGHLGDHPFSLKARPPESVICCKRSLSLSLWLPVFIVCQRWNESPQYVASSLVCLCQRWHTSPQYRFRNLSGKTTRHTETKHKKLYKMQALKAWSKAIRIINYTLLLFWIMHMTIITIINIEVCRLKFRAAALGTGTTGAPAGRRRRRPRRRSRRTSASILMTINVMMLIIVISIVITIYIYIYIYICVYIHTYIYIQTYTHTYIRTYIHTTLHT